MLAVLFVGAMPVAQASDFSVSVRPPDLKMDDRIVAITIAFRGARVNALPNLPMGWTVSVDNEGSWRGRVRASVLIGAAAVRMDAFSSFLHVEKYSRGEQIPFALTGELRIADYGHPGSAARTLALHPADFAMHPIP